VGFCVLRGVDEIPMSWVERGKVSICFKELGMIEERTSTDFNTLPVFLTRGSHPINSTSEDERNNLDDEIKRELFSPLSNTKQQLN
jgi:hypothetical protein